MAYRNRIRLCYYVYKDMVCVCCYFERIVSKGKLGRYYNKLDMIKDNILKVYKLGRRFTLEKSKYNRFFSEDLYAVNQSYLWKQTTDDYEISIKYSSNMEIACHTGIGMHKVSKTQHKDVFVCVLYSIFR